MQKVKLTKIPLDYILQVLTVLYEEGYDYFDLEGTVSEETEDSRDVIKITVREDYFSEEKREDDDTEEDTNFNGDYEKLL